MDMTGEYRISAPRQRVWEALNDPETLKAAIPGCEELTKLSDNEMEARVRAKVGPVSATFTGRVTLSDLDPPVSYKISGEGKGGAAGYAKGGANVSLAEDGADTVLSYNAKADVGGKLAQIGSRLIQGTAKKMADDFFSRFSRIVGEQHAAAAAVVAPVAPPPLAPEPVPPAAFEPVAAPPEAAEPEAPAAAVPPSLSTEAAAGGTPPFVPETPPQPSPAARAAPSQFVKRETAPPAPPPTPAAPPPAQPGMLQQPLVWAAIAVVILVLLYLIL
jgi:carbon monoxide dehydrogenase subunit G